MRFSRPEGARSRNFSVAIARGPHLFPFRTEQLSPSAPMVLGPRGPGRVGRRRFIYTGRPHGRPVVVPNRGLRRRYELGLRIAPVSALAIVLIVLGAIILIFLLGGFIIARRRGGRAGWGGDHPPAAPPGGAGGSTPAPPTECSSRRAPRTAVGIASSSTPRPAARSTNTARASSRSR